MKRTIRIQIETREVVAIHFCPKCGDAAENARPPSVKRLLLYLQSLLNRKTQRRLS